MTLRTQTSDARVGGLVLAALAMSVGWGFRGDYGHEAGAMVPGALLGLAICLSSGRKDWWQRSTIMAMCGAIGWAFGGQMSYGRVIGYTAGSSLPDVAYGYASLFLIGGLWGGTGAAILSLSITESRSYLERFAGPLVALYLVWFAIDLSGLTEWLAETWYFVTVEDVPGVRMHSGFANSLSRRIGAPADGIEFDVTGARVVLSAESPACGAGAGVIVDKDRVDPVVEAPATSP